MDRSFKDNQEILGKELGRETKTSGHAFCLLQVILLYLFENAPLLLFFLGYLFCL
jgi:hypothetical protein